MKPFDENDLIAYHLQELSPRRARALEKAMQEDPSLVAESENYASILRSFKGVMPLDVDEEIVDRNWSRIWSKLPRQPLRPASFRRWLIPILAGVGLAFAATAFFVSTHHSVVTPPSGPLQRPNHEVAQSRPSAENALSGDVLPDGAGTTPRILHLRSTYAAPLANRPVERLRPYDTPSRIIHPTPDAGEPPTALKFIPLARVPLPLSPTPELPPVTIAPEPRQESNTTAKRKHSHDTSHRDHPMDVTLAMGGMLIGTREFTNNGSTHSQGASPAVSANASFHQQLRPALGYRVAVSYSNPDFHYGSNGGVTNLSGRIYEVAGTYVVQGPRRGIVSTTIEGGAGLMRILPPDNGTTTDKRNLRGAAIVGVSAEFAVSRHLAVQTGYRIQVFKGPNFQPTVSSTIPILSTTLISNEPMVGITYRFSRK